MWRGVPFVLAALHAGCASPPSNDPALLSQSDSIAVLALAIEVAADSLAEFGPYDRLWLAQESQGRDSVYVWFSPEIAAALETASARLSVRTRQADFLVCPTSGPRFVGDCDVLDDGLALRFEGIRTTRDSLGIAVELGVGEPRGRWSGGWHAAGYAIHFRWLNGRWTQTGVIRTWEA